MVTDRRRRVDQKTWADGRLRSQVWAGERLIIVLLCGRGVIYHEILAVRLLLRFLSVYQCVCLYPALPFSTQVLVLCIRKGCVWCIHFHLWRVRCLYLCWQCPFCTAGCLLGRYCVVFSGVKPSLGSCAELNRSFQYWRSTWMFQVCGAELCVIVGQLLKSLAFTDASAWPQFGTERTFCSLRRGSVRFVDWRCDVLFSLRCIQTIG